MSHQKFPASRRRGPSRLTAALSAVGALLALAGACPAYAARADRVSFRQGAFYGQVVDAVTGKPVVDATVALQNRKKQVVAWTKTDAQGRYALAAPCMSLLDLPSPHHRGLLATIGRGFVDVVKLPVEAVGVAADSTADVIKAANPVGVVKAAAVGMIAGNPMPVATVAAGDAQTVFGASGQQTARTSAANAVVNGVPARKTAAPNGMPGPGAVELVISAPQHKEFQGPDGSYWMAAATKGKSARAPSCGPKAWLDTVQLAPSTDKKDSCTLDQAARLTAVTIDPSMPTAGSPVKITVQLHLPTSPAVKVCVVAREQKTGCVAELQPQGKGVYAGTLTLPKDSPTGDSTITIAALNAQPIDIRLDSGKKNPLLEYAAHLDDMDSGKTYQFDPRVMASENRLDFAIMVLDPSREQPILAAPTPIHAASPAIGSAAAASPGTPAAHAPAAVPASAPAVTAPAAKAAAPAAPPPGVPQSSSPVAAPPPASKPAAAGK